MGYFAYAYVVDAVEDNVGLTVSRWVYEVEDETQEGLALFSWDQGERPPGMHSYADGSLLCAKRLRPLQGYPLIRHFNRANEYQVEEGFLPQGKEAPVLFHLLLPTRFVPRPDRPLEQPTKPNVARFGDRLVISYGIRGGADIRFWIRRMEAGEDFDTHGLDHVLERSTSPATGIHGPPTGMHSVVQNVFHGPVGNLAQNSPDVRQTVNNPPVNAIGDIGEGTRAGLSTEVKIGIATLIVTIIGVIAAWLTVPGFLK
jgi:hypothetical protein